MIDEPTRDSCQPRRLLVGNGRDEASAIRDLSDRFAEFARNIREYHDAQRRPTVAVSPGAVDDSRIHSHRVRRMDGPPDTRKQSTRSRRRG
jgi:hypothetical protein